LQAVGGGEFALRLVPRQRAAPFYRGTRTHTHTYDSFNDFMRVIKSDVANSPKMFISSGKKCNMLSKF
jgi:hypothetical protein